MIRHSSSFLLSLSIHTAIIIAIFFLWKNAPAIEKKIEIVEKKVCVKLCDIHHKKPEIKPIEKPKELVPLPLPPKVKPKPIVEPKPTPKPKVKPKPKKKPKKKPKPKIKKKTIPKKIIPIIKEDIKPQEIEIVQAQAKEIITQEEPVKVILNTEVAESQYDREVRLEHDYLDKHIQKITQLLQENLYYPRSARKRGITGEVRIKFTLSTDAVAHSIEIISSKSETLSNAAIKTIENLSGDFPKPQEKLILHVPINYRLR